MLSLKKFDYKLPINLIAQKPIRPRDHSRLMILNREKKSITHDYFYNINKYIEPNSILVANNSKVIPARLNGEKPTKGKVEILLLKQLENDCWEIILKGKGKTNLKISFNKKLFGVLKKQLSDQTWLMKFSALQEDLLKALKKAGKTPTPPYIKRISNLREYQTIYAQHPGSSAAPTAGFHFTKKIIQKLKKAGIDMHFVTLHVGLGTFQPVRTENIENHQMHSEWGEIKKPIVQLLNKAKKEQKKIIAVGTTSCRVLEAFSSSNGKLYSGGKWIDLFIYPHDQCGVGASSGYKFKFIDGLITNFHLPKSTLLMLVSAFAGREFIFQAYKEAIKKKYRFYSFGDAMLII
ncbi:tRNA preQ1(34) S-adenosylmethionine ribosyltransferase-isomerase QueA [bacterium]|nr:tRNA preQ1(34) S-adenosylmethionine ribosyltransferase-isomerase QueA [bacterium]